MLGTKSSVGLWWNGVQCMCMFGVPKNENADDTGGWRLAQVLVGKIESEIGRDAWRERLDAIGNGNVR